jgi:site-specific recombinase XerD
MPRSTKNGGHFVSANGKAKSAAVAVLVRAARRARLNYDGFLYVCQQARRKLKLTRPQRDHKLPHLLPDSALKRFFQIIQECGDVQHEILLKLLFYTAVRVRELVRIRIDDVDLEHCRIFIQQGKGPKDRYILFPSGFRLVLRSHLKAHPENQYLFETTRCGPFTPRRVQQIVQSYRVRAGLTQPVHPHLFRHQMLTYLTAQGLSDAQLQLISGHASKKSLEIYQHLSLEAVEDAYQAAVRTLEI